MEIELVGVVEVMPHRGLTDYILVILKLVLEQVRRLGVPNLILLYLVEEAEAELIIEELMDHGLLIQVRRVVELFFYLLKDYQ